VCPQCGSADQVHSIEEWAAMAQANKGLQWQPGAPMPGYPAAPGSQPGYPPAPQPAYPSAPQPGPGPQSGFPDPSQYQQSGFPDPSAYQQPGPPGGSPQPPPGPADPQPTYQAGPQPSQQPGFEDAIGEAVLGAATKAIGRVIGRKMRQAYNERVVPAMAARQDAVLNQRTAIAQRHPDLRACLRDQVVFLVGGTRALPLASAMQVRTVEQSDALVAQLRG
jgi:hypothetical protein